MGKGIVVEPPGHTKVAIVGFGPSKYCLPRDWGREVWRMNYVDNKRFARFFHLHDRRTLQRDYITGYRIALHEMRTTTAPVYVWDPADWPDVRTAMAFPREQVEALNARGRYHQSSADWMFCLALAEGYTDIHIAGIGLGPEDGSEPIGARACLEYWIGVAETKGVTVTVAEPTSLFKSLNWIQHTTPYGAPNTRHVYHVTEEDVQRLGAQEDPYWWAQ